MQEQCICSGKTSEILRLLGFLQELGCCSWVTSGTAGANTCLPHRCLLSPGLACDLLAIKQTIHSSNSVLLLLLSVKNGTSFLAVILHHPSAMALHLHSAACLSLALSWGEDQAVLIIWKHRSCINHARVAGYSYQVRDNNFLFPTHSGFNWLTS